MSTYSSSWLNRWESSLCWDMVSTQEDITEDWTSLGPRDFHGEEEFELAMEHWDTCEGIGMHLVWRAMQKANRKLLKRVFGGMWRYADESIKLRKPLTLNCLDDRYAGMSVGQVIAERWRIRRM